MTGVAEDVARNDEGPGLRACLLIVLAFGVAIRGWLLFHGRMTVLDSFYLNAAARLAEGDTPYHDFTHVAFPFVEWLYAWVFRYADDLWRAASATTAIAAIGTSLLLVRTLRHPLGGWPSIVAAVAYLVAAPLVAYHAFEREVWTNLGLATALWITNREGRDSVRTAIWLGVVLAVTVLFKLTAAVGVLALLALAWRRHGRECAILAAAICGVTLLGSTLVFLALYGAEFGTQVFVFFFFKGAAGGLAERAHTFLRAIDPTLAIGLLGLAFARGTARPRGEPFTLLLAAWLLYYALFSPSYWDHNAIDLELPAAVGCGMLVAHLRTQRPRHAFDHGLIAGSVVCAVLATHLLEDEETRWDGTPFGLGLDVGEIVHSEAAGLAANTPEGSAVVVANPLVAVLARRRPFVSDFELEPVARGVLQEIRLRGFAAAFARRRDGILLGAPVSRPEPQAAGASLFAQRVSGNTLLHVMPRWLDAAQHHEIAAILAGPLPSDLEGVLTGAGYQRIQDPRFPTLQGWCLPR